MAKGKYETYIEPRLDEIKEWVENGCTNVEIIDNLEISKDTFYQYKKKHKEFDDILREGRTAKVKQLTGALFAKAVGGKRIAKEEYELNKETGELELVKQVVQYDPGSQSAIIYLLKHWDKNDDGTCKWSNEPAAIELKKRELELKKEIAEENNW